MRYQPSRHLKLPTAMLLAAASGMLALPCSTAAQDHSAVALPPGVKAVWDPAKALHETTPTRERLCINGLWRWQPAAEDATAKCPTAAWGYFKVPACWPGIQDYMQSDYQTLYPDPAWKNTNLAEVQSAWYQRTITIPRNWAGRRIALDVEYLNSYAAVYVDGRKVGEIRFPAGEVDLTAAVPSGGHACPEPAGRGDAAQSRDGILQRYQHRASRRRAKSNAAACAAMSG